LGKDLKGDVVVEDLSKAGSEFDFIRYYSREIFGYLIDMAGTSTDNTRSHAKHVIDAARWTGELRLTSHVVIVICCVCVNRWKKPVFIC